MQPDDQLRRWFCKRFSDCYHAAARGRLKNSRVFVMIRQEAKSVPFLILWIKGDYVDYSEVFLGKTIRSVFPN